MINKLLAEMSLRLGDEFPDFGAETSQGSFDSFHKWMGDGKWAILFSHPADFTPVCTTELARAAQLVPEFEKRHAKLIALSCDSVESHRGWLADIVEYGNKMRNFKCDVPKLDAAQFPFPIIGDVKRLLATKLGMLDPLNFDMAGIPMTVRAVFMVDPKKKLRLQILYPASTGRNFDELLRVLDSMQLSDKHMLATPEGWLSGHSCMVEPRVTDERAMKLFGGKDGEGVERMEVPSGKKYIRIVEQPKDE